MKDYFEAEEYFKGSDYAPIFKQRFSKSAKCFFTKDGKRFKAGMSPTSDYYVVSKKYSWLHASRHWLLENGWHKDYMMEQIAMG